jgi:ketosteroid isomerase-like protein
MSAERNLAVASDFLARLDQADFSFLDDSFEPDAAIHFPGLPGPADRVTIRPVWGSLHAAFPGFTHRIVDSVATDDKISLRLAIEGVHTGDFQGIPPSGRPFAIEAIDIIHMRDGKVSEMWIQYDSVGLLIQIGAMPVPA